MSIQLKTFHFKFSPIFIEHLERFAKIHQYDDRHTFKEAWTTWTKTDSISKIIEEEIADLTKDGFDGNILEKMFKSARYYYRKKPETKDVIAKKKKYEGSSRSFLEQVDAHISHYVHTHSVSSGETIKSTASPAEAYDDFCKTHEIVGMDEAKQKKTYKNRYYLFSKKTQPNNSPM